MVLQIISLLAVALSVAHCHSLSRRQALDPTTLPDSLWPKAIVAVGYNDHVLQDDDLLNTMIEAQLEIQFSTCVKFVDIDELLPEEFAHPKLIFETGTYDRCLTPIGHQANAEQQPARISISFLTTEDAIHEVLHALGLVHTQNRPDARSYTTVNSTNVRVYDQAQFSPWENVTTYDIPYEYGSIMHYDDKQYAIQLSSRTLIAVEPLHQQTMGSRTGMSFYDVQLINKQYSCAVNCENDDDKPECSNGGYQNPSNCSACICPATFDDQNYCEGMAAGVEELPATTEYTTLSRIYTGDGQRKNDWTFDYFWITTNSYSLIEVVITELPTACQSGCIDGGVELKAAADKAATGYRFCCNTSLPTTITTKGPLPVIFFNRIGNHTYTLNYKQVVDPAKCDEKYSLFTKEPATSAIVISLKEGCRDNNYLATADDKLQCEYLADNMLTVLETPDIGAMEQLDAIKRLFDSFTDAGNSQNRVDFTKTTIIPNWGSFYNLLNCLVTEVPTTPDPTAPSGGQGTGISSGTESPVSKCATFYTVLRAYPTALANDCDSYWAAANRSAEQQTCNALVTSVLDTLSNYASDTYRQLIQKLKNQLCTYTDYQLITDRVAFLTQAHIATWGTVQEFIRCPIDKLSPPPTVETIAPTTASTAAPTPLTPGDCGLGPMQALLAHDANNRSCITRALLTACAPPAACAPGTSSGLSVLVQRIERIETNDLLSTARKAEQTRTSLTQYIGNTQARKSLLYPLNITADAILWGTVETFVNCS